MTVEQPKNSVKWPRYVIANYSRQMHSKKPVLSTNTQLKASARTVAIQRWDSTVGARSRATGSIKVFIEIEAFKATSARGQTPVSKRIPNLG